MKKTLLWFCWCNWLRKQIIACSTAFKLHAVDTFETLGLEKKKSGSEGRSAPSNSHAALRHKDGIRLMLTESTLFAITLVPKQICGGRNAEHALHSSCCGFHLGQAWATDQIHQGSARQVNMSHLLGWPELATKSLYCSYPQLDGGTKYDKMLMADRDKDREILHLLPSQAKQTWLEKSDLLPVKGKSGIMGNKDNMLSQMGTNSIASSALVSSRSIFEKMALSDMGTKLLASCHRCHPHSPLPTFAE